MDNDYMRYVNPATFNGLSLETESVIISGI
jgi:hypothetical protein